VLHDAKYVLAIADNFEKILITDEIESREGSTLPFQVFSESFLYLVQEICEAF
jgi:hypothetical protein